MTVPEFRTATVIRPGDHVLITMEHEPELAQELIEQLEERFPDTTFTIVSQTTGIAVKRAKGQT